MAETNIPAEFMSKVAEYISQSQQVIQQLHDTQSRERQVLREKVANAVATMVDKGYASSDERMAIIQELTDHPVKIAEALDRVIRDSELPTLGTPSGEPDGHTIDPITRFALVDGPSINSIGGI